MESLANMPRRPRSDKENIGASPPLPCLTVNMPLIHTKEELLAVLSRYVGMREQDLHFEYVLDHVNLSGSSSLQVQEVFSMLTHLAVYAPTTGLLSRVKGMVMSIKNTQQWEEVDDISTVDGSYHGQIWVRRGGPLPVSPEEFTIFEETVSYQYTVIATPLQSPYWENTSLRNRPANP